MNLRFLAFWIKITNIYRNSCYKILLINVLLNFTSFFFHPPKFLFSISKSSTKKKVFYGIKIHEKNCQQYSWNFNARLLMARKIFVLINFHHLHYFRSWLLHINLQISIKLMGFVCLCGKDNGASIKYVCIFLSMNFYSNNNNNDK